MCWKTYEKPKFTSTDGKINNSGRLLYTMKKQRWITVHFEKQTQTMPQQNVD